MVEKASHYWLATQCSRNKIWHATQKQQARESSVPAPWIRLLFLAPKYTMVSQENLEEGCLLQLASLTSFMTGLGLIQIVLYIEVRRNSLVYPITLTPSIKRRVKCMSPWPEKHALTAMGQIMTSRSVWGVPRLKPAQQLLRNSVLLPKSITPELGVPVGLAPSPLSLRICLEQLTRKK